MRTRGYSLVEVVAVLAILAVLAALSLPGFRAHILKGRRAEARDALHAVQLAQERFRSRSPRYAATLEELALANTTRSGLYRLRIVQADATRYLVEAIAQGSQTSDHPCQLLTLRVEAGSVQTSGSDARGGEQAQACWPQ